MPIKLASKIVNAYLRANSLPAAEVPALILQVATALERAAEPPAATPELVPAVPVRKSIQPEALTCLECGARQKTLKRHLQLAHGLSPDAYRARWDLGGDYPMVAPDYAERRSQLAKEAGLGRKPANAAPAESDKGKAGFQYPASRWSKPAK